jgi:hypothetical protein
MITKLFQQRPSLFREARLAYFAGAPGGGEAPKSEPEVTLDTKMKLETPDAIGRAKDVRIKAAEDATHDIDATMVDKLAKIASLELTELTKEKKDPEDITNAAQTIQDRFAHAGILATPVIDPTTNAVTWTFETLSITASDIPGGDTMDKTVLDPLLQQLNGLESGKELVVKELLKSDPEAAGKLMKFGDPSVRKGAEVAMDLVDWKDPDASIANIADADTKSAVEALRAAVADDAFLVKMQEAYRRVEGQSAPASSASESGVQLTPEQQKKLDNSLNTNISKMKDYEVMRVQGQIMMDFGVNVVVEGEGDARKLKAEPVDEKSQKFTKFMGLIMVAGSYIAQLMELKNRIEGKSTGDGKEKSDEAAPEPPPASGDKPPVEEPGEAPEATALKKGEEKLAAANAKKEGDVHVLDLKHSADPKFSFQEGRWKVAFNDDPAMDVGGLSYNENVGSEESKKETVILNALLKELADVNKDGQESKAKKGVDTFNAENPIAEARANGDRIELFIKDESQCSAMALERKCALTGMNGVRVDGGILSIANTDENSAKLPELKNNLTKTVRESPEKMQQLYLMALAEAIDAADPVSGLKGSIIDSSKASDPDVANRLKSSADIVSAIRTHLKADASTNFMVMKGSGNDNLYLNDGYTNDTDLIYGFGTMISGSADTVKQALEMIVGDQTVEKFANMSESGEKNRYAQFRGVLEKKMRGLEKQYSK